MKEKVWKESCLKSTLHLFPELLLRSVSSSTTLSRVQLFVTPWTVACQAPLSMGFSRQEYWSGLPFPPPGDLPDPGTEPRSPVVQADSLPLRRMWHYFQAVPSRWAGLPYSIMRAKRGNQAVGCIFSICYWRWSLFNDGQLHATWNTGWGSLRSIASWP